MRLTVSSELDTRLEIVE
jgi:hypothetical protein